MVICREVQKLRRWVKFKPMHSITLKDRKTSKVIAEAEYELSRKGMHVSISIDFPRPHLFEIIYKTTIGPALLIASWVLLKAKNTGNLRT